VQVLLFHRGGIGDIVFAVPLIDDLRAGFPNAKLIVLTHSKGEQVLRFCPRIDRIIAVGEMERSWSMSEARAALQAEPFDVSVTTSVSARASYLIWGTGARVRAGFTSALGRMLLTHLASRRPFEVVFSRRYQRLAEALGIPSVARAPALEIPPAQREEAGERLRRRGWDGRETLIAVHIGGGWPTKQWPAEHIGNFARLADQRYGAKVLLQGSAADVARAEQIAAMAKGMVLSSVGNSVAEAIAESAVCKVAVGIDSGLSHATAACGTPTVFLFGPNEPGSILLSKHRQILTRDLECRPCNRAGIVACPLKHHRCMREQSPEAVLEAASSWISPAV
jgi:lipopolysaccharide heptosyltransferase II